MNITDVTLLKTRGAVTEVEVPHLDKPFIKTQRLDLLKSVKESHPPIEESPGIILTDIFQVKEL